MLRKKDGGGDGAGNGGGEKLLLLLLLLLSLLLLLPFSNSCLSFNLLNLFLIAKSIPGGLGAFL